MNQFWSMFATWGVSTALLWLFRDKKSRNSSNTQEAEKNRNTNTSSIDSPIPVVIGRAMIKSPLVSYYGDFEAVPYTEEYGMHTKFDWRSLIPQILLAIIATIAIPSTVVTNTGGGTVTDDGPKRTAIVYAVVSVLLQLLTALFSRHMGRTTIQKGFKYYLGWQNIICWTGENVGIKSIYMNVYDSNIKDSLYQGVWNASNGGAAYKKENQSGIITRIDKPDLFGGVDEGGGFVGDIHVYLGTQSQPKDPWMVSQMSQDSISADLRGLTPRYPMYVTCVIPKAYIGKQSTIPEMWFEIVNYPNTLREKYPQILTDNYNKSVEKYTEIINKLEAIPDDKILWAQEEALRQARKKLNEITSHGVPRLDPIGEDCNPAEAIFEILTNDYWGGSANVDVIDIESLIELGITCEYEELGVSLNYATLGTVSDPILKILEHINGVMFDNPKTGKLSFKLLRNDFDETKIKKFDESNCINMVFSRVDWHETSSSVSASFVDAAHFYDTGQVYVSDLANIEITHNQHQVDVDATYFTTARNAKIMAQNKLFTSAYPLATVEFECNRYAYDLTLGEAIKISWAEYGIKETIFRVTAIDYGSLSDGTIKISAIEDVFSFDKTEYMISNGLAYVEPVYKPMKVERYAYIEMPYELSASLDTFVSVVAVQPSAHTTVWNIWYLYGGKYQITSHSNKWGMGARTVYEILEEYEYDENATIEIKPIGYNSKNDIDYKMRFIAQNPSVYNNKSALNLIQIDNEIISYDSIDIQINGNYLLKGIIRGVYDTVPALHTTEAIVYFLDEKKNIYGTLKPVAEEGTIADYSSSITSETKDEKQEFNINEVHRRQTVRRSESPSIMSYLKYGMDLGEYTILAHNTNYNLSGNIKYTFNYRNKFYDPSIFKQSEQPKIELASSLYNYLKMISGGHQWEIQYKATDDDNKPITEMLYTWEEYCKEMTINLSLINTLSVEIGTYNSENSLHSYESYNKSITYTMPRMAGIFASKTELDDYLKENTDNMGVRIESDFYDKYNYQVNECTLFFIGTECDKDDEGAVHNFDNKYYLLKDAYQLVNIEDKGGSKYGAHIVKIEPKDYYTMQSKYVPQSTTPNMAYQLNGDVWKEYKILR